MLFGVLAVHVVLFAAEELKLPFEDNGACPFECCTYKKWTVAKDTDAFETHEDNSKLVFKMKKGEEVEGLTGIVITMKPGAAAIKKTISLGQDESVTILAGENIALLHYEGEGFSKFWYKGKTYSDEIPFPGEETESIKTLSEPETVWWVKIKNSKGETGWSHETDHFDHMDSCE